MLSSALQIVLLPCPFPSTFQNPHLLFPRHSFSVSQCIHCMPEPRVAACPGCNCVCRLIPTSQVGKQPLRPRPGHPCNNRQTHIKGTDGRGGLEHYLCPEWEWIILLFLAPKQCVQMVDPGWEHPATVGAGTEERSGHRPPGWKADIG